MPKPRCWAEDERRDDEGQNERWRKARPLGFLDRSRRHLHRRHRPRFRRPAACAQAAFGKPRLRRRRRAGDPRSLASFARRADPQRRNRRRQDGHHRRHQRAARAPRRAHAAGDDQGFSRRARDRLSGAPENLRPQHRQAGAALCRRRRDRRARARRRNGRGRAGSRRPCAPSSRAPRRQGFDAVAIVFMHAYRYPRARAAGRRRSRARSASPRFRSATSARR